MAKKKPATIDDLPVNEPPIETIEPIWNPGGTDLPSEPPAEPTPRLQAERDRPDGANLRLASPP